MSSNDYYTISNKVALTFASRMLDDVLPGDEYGVDPREVMMMRNTLSVMINSIHAVMEERKLKGESK